MLEINTEAIFGLEHFLNRGKKVLIAIQGFITFTADQMMVMSFFRMVIDKSVTCSALANTIQLFQELQRPVDCRLVHTGHLTPDHLDDIFTGNVTARFMDNVQNQPALRSQPESIFSKDSIATHIICTKLQLSHNMAYVVNTTDPFIRDNKSLKNNGYHLRITELTFLYPEKSLICLI